MKRNLICCILAALTLLLCACAKKQADEPRGSAVETPEVTEEVLETATPEPEATEAPAEPDYEAIYAAKLREIKAFIQQGANADAVPDGLTGILETAAYMEPDEAMNLIGYRIEDLSGDKVPELIIGVTADEAQGSVLLNIYTILPDESISLTVEGWGRNRYNLLNDGSLLNIGSNGAAYAIVANYTFSEDASKLECRDYYFTYEKVEGNWDDIGVYHNTTGAYDKSQAELTGMTTDELWGLEEQYMSRIQQVYLTPFAEFES